MSRRKLGTSHGLSVGRSTLTIASSSSSADARRSPARTPALFGELRARSPKAEPGADEWARRGPRASRGSRRLRRVEDDARAERHRVQPNRCRDWVLLRPPLILGAEGFPLALRLRACVVDHRLLEGVEMPLAHFLCLARRDSLFPLLAHERLTFRRCPSSSDSRIARLAAGSCSSRTRIAPV